jgi:urea transport system substrate-binding protein
MKRLTGLLMACAIIAALALTTQAQAPGPIKVGILHSLSGTMAISETTLKDTVLMMIAEQNKKGGLLGRKLEAVVVDPASNWPLFAEKASQLLTQDKVCGGIRMLDVGVAQVCAPRLREKQRAALLPRPVRG